MLNILRFALLVWLAGCVAAPEQQAEPDCTDGVLNGLETDVDCGGTACAACPVEGLCDLDGDCATGLCDAGVCACESGYQATGVSACADVDECALGTDDCDDSEVCTNIDGGFDCACAPGTQDVDGTCETCPPGSWGVDCAQDCALGDCATQPTCDPVTGQATACGSCDPGTWGTLCDQSCELDACVGTVTCDLSTGELLACPDGCEPGTYGATCEQTCAFGDCIACSETAPCASGTTCRDGFCLGDTGQGCSDDRQCSDVCLAGACSEPSTTLGQCESATDCLDPDAHSCVFGSCLLNVGSACNDNMECADTCIDGRCAWPAVTGETCDETDDCGIDNDCIDGVCRLMDGANCDDNEACDNTCVQGTCGPSVELYGACDDIGDCADALVCEGGTCLVKNGTACTDDAQCEDTCIRGVCADNAGTREACDNYIDCRQLHDCVAGECLLQDNAECDVNNDCVNVCVFGLCNPVRDLSERCDEDADCTPGTRCIDDVCLFDAGEQCDINDECADVCIFEVCQDQSDTGGACDETLDCVAGHQCINDVCLAEDGEECLINSDCINVCIDGTCAPESPLDGVCDEDDDCEAGHLCTDDGICKLAEGGQCTTDDDCATINTHCIGGACLTDITPNPIDFSDQACVQPGSTITSNTVSLDGFYGPLTLTIDGAATPVLILNGSETPETTTTVMAGDSVALRVTAPAQTQASTQTSAVVGSASDVWSVSTAPNLSPGSQVQSESGVISGGTRTAYGNTFTVPYSGVYDVNTSLDCEDRINNGNYHYTWCSAALQRQSGGTWSSVVSHAHHNGQCCTGHGKVVNRSTQSVTLVAGTQYRFGYFASPRIGGYPTQVYSSGASVNFQRCQ